MAAGPASETERCNESEPVVEPAQGWNRLEPGGCGPGNSARRSARTWSSTPKPTIDVGGEAITTVLRVRWWRGCSGRAGRRSCRPTHSERGQPLSGRPSRPAASRSSGQAHRQLTARAWGRRVRSSPRPGKPVTWRRDPSEFAVDAMECQEVAGEYRREPWPGLDEARARVLGIQTKLHQWSNDDADRRFDDSVQPCHRSSRSSRSRGIGCGGIEEHDLPESMAWFHVPSCSATRCCTGCEPSSSPQFRAAPGQGADDPQGVGQVPSPRHPCCPGSGRAGQL